MVPVWLERVGRFKVEHVPCPHPSLTVDFAHSPARAVQHTTEGSLAGALAKFRQIDAPHFLLGADQGRVRVLQLIALGYAAAALEHPPGTPATNGAVRVQVELADFAKRWPWLPHPEGVQEALGALYAAVQHVAGVPLIYRSNRSRDRAFFERHGGWYGHGDVPDQHLGHWDPGDLQFSTIFAHARSVPKPPVRPKPRPMVLQPRTVLLVRRANGLVYADNIERPH